MLERHRRAVRRAMGTPAFIGVLLLGVVAASIGGPAAKTSAAQTVTASRSKRPPVPSQAPQHSAFRPSNEAVDVVVERSSLTPPASDSGLSLPTDLAPSADDALAAVMHKTVQQWIDRWGVPGVEVGLLKPGVVTWTGAAGVDLYTGQRTKPDDALDIDSITKTFTAALTLQLVDSGQLDLDAPLPALDAVPSFPYAADLTVRELLTHTSGLVNYRDTAAWAANADDIDSPEHAIAAAGAEPLKYAPGTGSNYSSTNYLVLGMLIEQITGVSYDDLLNREYVRPLALTHTWHAPPEAQAPNFAASGVNSTLGDLLRWATALYRERIVVSPASFELMSSIDPQTWLGTGSFGYCPCTIDPNGVHHFRYIGHSGGRTVLEYSALDDLIVVVNATDSMWIDGRGAAVTELTEQLRALVATLASPPAG